MDRVPAEVGSTVELTDVLLVGDNGDVRVGTPTVEGARVLAEVVEQGRDKKLVVFKYKAKTRYHRKRGHRQGYTRLVIRRILTGDETAEVERRPKRAPRAAAEVKAEAPVAEAKLKRARKRAATKAQAGAAEAEAVAVAPEAAAPAVEAKPRRPRRAAKTDAPAEEPAAEGGSKEPTEAKPPRRARARSEVGREKQKTPRRRSKKTESD